MWIPGIYNGNDRTFWNFNYTYVRNAPPINGSLVSVPPQAFRNGDSSGYTDTAGALIPIFDPATTTSDGARTPFAGNMMPRARLSPTAQRALSLVPDPDTPGYFNNFVHRASKYTEDDIWSLKLDHLFKDKHRVSYSMWHSLNDGLARSEFGN